MTSAPLAGLHGSPAGNDYHHIMSLLHRAETATTTEHGREILFQLTDVARAMRTYIDQCAREHGMTRAQWGALPRLERQEGMTQAEMAETLEIQPISLVRLIDRRASTAWWSGARTRAPAANRLDLTDKGHTTWSA